MSEKLKPCSFCGGEAKKTSSLKMNPIGKLRLRKEIRRRKRCYSLSYK